MYTLINGPRFLLLVPLPPAVSSEGYIAAAKMQRRGRGKYVSRWVRKLFARFGRTCVNNGVGQQRLTARRGDGGGDVVDESLPPPPPPPHGPVDNIVFINYRLPSCECVCVVWLVVTSFVPSYSENARRI